ncbi:uncharacterized protein LOC123008767 [Tribolium madens]|uniref:uncharacterized protein LOC123008767 n=1 Tax=Tribolium madens TaxID=41895 RepID=UPI001CF7362C|nr:uncharacterized protein LOC123008767 [Tribolium madens]
MFDRKLVLALVFVIFATLAVQSEGRYLPTRSNGDRIEKLRELLKDLFENEVEKEEYQADAPPRWHPESKLFYKREAPAH